MSDLRIEVRGLQELRAFMRDLPAEMFDSAKAEFRESALALQANTQNRIRSGPLHTRTGQLRRSIKTSVTGNTINTLKSSTFSDSAYAPIHETGGVVQAKRAYRGVPGGPYLNIPLPANKTPAGVTRLAAREVFSQGGYIIKNKIVMLRDQPMFVLKKQVRIPARLGMQTEADAESLRLLKRLQEMAISRSGT